MLVYFKTKRFKVYLGIALSIFIALPVSAAFFYLATPPDSLCDLAPENQTVFYVHFNINTRHLIGNRAYHFLKDHWPREELSKLYAKYPAYELFKYNFNVDALDAIDEFSIVFLKDGEEMALNPVVIYRFKPSFSPPIIITGKKGESRLYGRLLDNSTAVISLKENLLQEFSAPTRQPFLKLISFPQYINNNFLDGYATDIFLAGFLPVNNYFSFLEKETIKKNERINFSARNLKNLISFEVRVPVVKNEESRLFEDRFSSFVNFLSPEAGLSAFFNLETDSGVQKFFEPNNISFIEKRNRTQIYFRGPQFSPDLFWDDFKNNLARAFPEEKEMILPDKTKAIEYIMNPDRFFADQEQINNFILNKVVVDRADLSPEDRERAWAFNDRFVILGNNINFVKKIIGNYYLNLREKKIAENFLILKTRCLPLNSQKIVFYNFSSQEWLKGLIMGAVFSDNSLFWGGCFFY